MGTPPLIRLVPSNIVATTEPEMVRAPTAHEVLGSTSMSYRNLETMVRRS